MPIYIYQLNVERWGLMPTVLIKVAGESNERYEKDGTSIVAVETEKLAREGCEATNSSTHGPISALSSRRGFPTAIMIYRIFC